MIAAKAVARKTMRDHRADALTLTSSEGLDNLCTLLDAASLRRLQALPTFVPHPRIADHARSKGFAANAKLAKEILNRNGQIQISQPSIWRCSQAAGTQLQAVEAVVRSEFGGALSNDE